MASSSGTTLAERVKAGEPRAIARAISLIEDEAPEAPALAAALHGSGRRSFVLGVTGSPGSGKSTLVDRLAAALRADGVRVGILAVDPTSPFTGGAILGDRVRMQAHASDPGVFIRSMATRGHLGGLARATGDAATVLEAAGFEVVVIETVGVGQDEIDIVRTADASIVVLVPGAGDEVQALKAGVMEIADIFVVNKADREGADRAVAAVEAMLTLGEPADASRGAPAASSASPAHWRPPILRTVATTGAGVRELLDAVERFRREVAPSHGERRRQRAEYRLREAVVARCLALADRAVPGAEWDALVARIDDRRLDPYTAAAQVVARLTRVGRAGDEGEDR